MKIKKLLLIAALALTSVTFGQKKEESKIINNNATLDTNESDGTKSAALTPLTEEQKKSELKAASKLKTKKLKEVFTPEQMSELKQNQKKMKGNKNDEK